MSEQKNLILTSVRLAPEVLSELDRFAKIHPYWTRNAMINKILKVIVRNTNDGELYDLIRSDDFRNCKITIEYEVL